jgi:hypothetical protein
MMKSCLKHITTSLAQSSSSRIASFPLTTILNNSESRLKKRLALSYGIWDALQGRSYMSQLFLCNLRVRRYLTLVISKLRPARSQGGVRTSFPSTARTTHRRTPSVNIWERSSHFKLNFLLSLQQVANIQHVRGAHRCCIQHVM